MVFLPQKRELNTINFDVHILLSKSYQGISFHVMISKIS